MSDFILTNNHLINARTRGENRARVEIGDGHDKPLDDVWEHVDAGETLLAITTYKVPLESAEAFELLDAFENGYYDFYDEAEI